jgi:hypothetical protein
MGSPPPSWAVIPTLPSSIYEHTIAAVPNFDHRVSPETSSMFFLVNVVLVAVLLVSVLMEVQLVWGF